MDKILILFTMKGCPYCEIMKESLNENNIEYFVETTFNYPTMAEAFRVAALNGLNRLF